MQMVFNIFVSIVVVTAAVAHFDYPISLALCSVVLVGCLFKKEGPCHVMHAFWSGYVRRCAIVHTISSPRHLHTFIGHFNKL